MIPAKVRRLVRTRSNGVCELCGAAEATNQHHRRPQAMGGTKRVESNSAANLLDLCGSGTTGCHGAIESARLTAFDFGWLLKQSQDPRLEPVRLTTQFGQGWFLLDEDGGYTPVHKP